MADYPSAFFDPRLKEEKAGVIYDPAKKTVIFAQDQIVQDAEIVAIETELGINPKGPYPDVKDRLDALQEQIDFLPYECYTLQVSAANQTAIVDGVVYYWGGSFASVPSIAQGNYKIYIPRAGVILAAYLRLYAQTAGSAEGWTLSILKNDIFNYDVASISASANERLFSNIALNIPVAAGDYIVIKEVTPTWVTNPANILRMGTLYIEVT
jgi:hypothetical protein